MPHRNPPLQTLFREILQTFLADYLRLVEPDSPEHLDLARITLPAPGELPRWSEEERRDVGVVAAVPSRWRENVTLLVQIEPDALAPAEMSRRIGRYFMDLELHYCQPVLLNVVYLRGGRPGINLETAPLCRVFGMDVLRLYFTTFGLEGSRAEYYLERPEPLAWALAALMAPVRLSRARLRQLCRQRIAGAGLDPVQAGLLTRFVDTFVEEQAGR